MPPQYVNLSSKLTRLFVSVACVCARALRERGRGLLGNREKKDVVVRSHRSNWCQLGRPQSSRWKTGNKGRPRSFGCGSTACRSQQTRHASSSSERPRPYKHLHLLQLDGSPRDDALLIIDLISHTPNKHPLSLISMYTIRSQQNAGRRR